MSAARLWQQSYITAEQTARHYAERGRFFGEDRTPDRCECELSALDLMDGLHCSCGYEERVA